MHLNPDDIFHTRYKIISKLGEGGMGTVYLATQIDSEREVAIKLLHGEALESEKDRARFLRELRILSHLSHENILTFYSAAINDDGILYAVFEYMQGQTLFQVLQAEKQISWARTWKIIEQVCRAMQFAHDQGIIHRDLKPENIMLLHHPEEDYVKILDFGFARTYTPEQNPQKLTATGMAVGTICYMSPEQCRAAKLDGRADIYALACIIYECLAGKLLFESDNPMKMLQMHLHRDPAEPMQALKSRVPSKLLNVLVKALSKDPNKRYQTMAEFSKALQNFEDAPDNLTTESSELAAKNRKAMMIQTGLVSLLGFVFVAVVFAINFKKHILLSEVMDPGKEQHGKSAAAAVLLQHADVKNLLSVGEDNYKNHDLPGAERMLRQALLITEKKHHPSFLANFLITKVYYEMGKPELGEKPAFESIRIAKKEYGPKSEQYMLSLSNAASIMKNKDLPLAKRLAREALDIWPSLHNLIADLNLTDILTVSTGLYFLEGTKSAAEQAQQDLLKYETLYSNEETPAVLVQKYLSLQANSKIEAGKFLEAQKIADRAVTTLTAATRGVDRQICSLYMSWADIYYRAGSTQKAVEQLHLSEDALISMKSPDKYLAETYLTEATMLVNNGKDPEAALKVLEKTLPIVKPAKKPNYHAAEVWFLKAAAYAGLSQKNLALTCMKKAHEAYTDKDFDRRCAKLTRDIEAL